MAITDEDKTAIAEMRETAKSITQSADVLAYMKQHGSFLSLDWGEDTNQWECSLMSGGERFTGVARSVLSATMQCYEATVTAKLNRGGDRLPQKG